MRECRNFSEAVARSSVSRSGSDDTLPVLPQGIPAGKPVIGFIIDAPFQTLQTGAQGKRLDMKDGIFAVGLGQVVIGDLRSEVVNVMETNVPREPLQ